MKTLYLLIAILTTSFTFGQMNTSPVDIPGDFETIRTKHFTYDGKSGFTFFKRMIYSEIYDEEWWLSLKRGKKTYQARDERNNQFNIDLKDELSQKLQFPFLLQAKYISQVNRLKLDKEVLSKERYIIDYENEMSADHMYTNYYIYDMKENKKYFIKATTNISKVIDKLIKIIEG